MKVGFVAPNQVLNFARAITLHLFNKKDETKSISPS